MALTERELEQAIKEAHNNVASVEYFEPRRDHRITGAQAFDAGFSRGWYAGRAPLLERIAALEAHQVEQAAQPVYEMYKGEVCFRSDDDDQSFGMLCPAHDIPDGTKLYTSPPKAAPLTISEDDAFNLAKHVYAHSQPYDAPQILLTGKELKSIIEAAANGITPATVEKEGE